MITGISGFGFLFVRKWPFRGAYLLFKTCLGKTPIFIVFFVLLTNLDPLRTFKKTQTWTNA